MMNNGGAMRYEVRDLEKAVASATEEAFADIMTSELKAAGGVDTADRLAIAAGLIALGWSALMVNRLLDRVIARLAA
jgi:hypothetical protein